MRITQGTFSFLPDFTDAALRDPEVLRVSDRIHFVTDAQYDWKMHLPGGRVTLTTKDGRSLSAECLSENVRGSSVRPLTWDELQAKFEECSSVSAAPVSAAAARELYASLLGLEGLRDVAPVMRLLAPQG